MSDDLKRLLYQGDNTTFRMTRENAGELLNVLWAFGLANKNDVLENGPITYYDGKQSSSRDEIKAKAGRMAATGGWWLATGNPMDHYSEHRFVALSPEQQKLVEKVASGIYRPCCGNPTHFPDCNHGMAMLGLLELMAAKGASEDEMFDVALAVNSFWFPDTYLTLAAYFERHGVAWSDVDPKVVLGMPYSSSSGFARIRQKIIPPQSLGGGGCSV